MKIKDLIPIYLNYLKTLGRTANTLRSNKFELQWFMKFLTAEKVYQLEDLTTQILEEYQQELAFYLTAKGRQLSLKTQSHRLIIVRGFTRFLKEKDYLINDPGERIKLPKIPDALPKVILSEKEIQKLMNAPDMQTNQGYRDRIILEILYDTAIRRDETRNIKLSDLDLEAGYIRITGKGNKQRVVPLSDRVCKLTQNYLMLVRTYFIKDNDPGYLFLNRWGKQMHPMAVWWAVKRYLPTAGINKRVSTHTMRHSCATHMLKNGAPIRYIQEMLGHASLDSTQVYTRVTINDLKEIHQKFHPGETDKP